MKPTNTINAILDALAEQRRQGEKSLIAKIEPNLIQDAVSSLREYRKLFAPVVPGVTDTDPIYAKYEEMRQEDQSLHTILLLVECPSIDEFREALLRMPIRKSSEWRSMWPTDSETAAD